MAMLKSTIQKFENLIALLPDTDYTSASFRNTVHEIKARSTDAVPSWSTVKKYAYAYFEPVGMRYTLEFTECYDDSNDYEPSESELLKTLHDASNYYVNRELIIRKKHSIIVEEPQSLIDDELFGALAKTFAKSMYLNTWTISYEYVQFLKNIYKSECKNITYTEQDLTSQFKQLFANAWY